MLNEKAETLEIERTQLLAEKRKLSETSAPLPKEFEPDAYKATLSDFLTMVEEAEPTEIQRLLRMVIKTVEWMPEGPHKLHYYYLPKQNQPSSKADKDWFAN